MMPVMMEMMDPSDRPSSFDPRIDRTTMRIRDLIGGTHLQMALNIGRIVIEELFEGDLARWHQRGPKDPSLRQLAADPRLTISASALYRSLGIYELKLRHRDHPMWGKLTACHLRAVLGLPESEQSRLLDLATAETWTTQVLEQAAATSRDNHKTSRGGRPRKPLLIRAIESAERALIDNEDAEVASPDALVDLPAEQRCDLLRRLHLLRERCSTLAAVLKADLPEVRAWAGLTVAESHAVQ